VIVSVVLQKFDAVVEATNLFLHTMRRLSGTQGPLGGGVPILRLFRVRADRGEKASYRKDTAENVTAHICG
jgi:hypothetical protein